MNASLNACMNLKELMDEHINKCITPLTKLRKLEKFAHHVCMENNVSVLGLMLFRCRFGVDSMSNRVKLMTLRTSGGCCPAPPVVFSSRNHA